MFPIDQIIDLSDLDEKKIQRILKDSLSDPDFFSKKSIRELLRLGLVKKEALALLSQFKSKIKYGYEITPPNIFYLFDLADRHKKHASIQHLLDSPFFLMKACWVYEHAPYFLFYDEHGSEDLDELMLKLADQYNRLFLNHDLNIHGWEKLKNPRQVMAVTFWENQVFNPVALIEKSRRLNIIGLELSIDFHPFNYMKLLPEELDKDHRQRIKLACQKSGLKIDIHSPIVGPYFPSPDPKKGRQLFFNPMHCFDLVCETIELAKDIGAGSVVVHLIDKSDIKKMADLISHAGGSRVRVTLENYCQTDTRQNSAVFIECANEITKCLPKEVKNHNFGITLDVGHLNIEGEDPLIASEKIGRWCMNNQVFLRLHATDNYGKLLFSPPAYSADVHGNVTGRGINNATIIKLLRSMGLQFDVVAEQIQPLSEEDIALIHEAGTFAIPGSYGSIVEKGKNALADTDMDAALEPNVSQETAYLFLVGLEGIPALRQHLVYRKIQDHKYLSVDEARKISQHFMKMPKKFKEDVIDYVDDLLLPVQSEWGVLQKSELDLICHNISGALFASINNEHLNQIFARTQTFHKGDLICKQGTLGQEMYFIKKGRVVVLINESPVASLMPGEIFGEISLFYNIKRTATIKASEDHTMVGVLSRVGFENLLKRSGPFTHDLIYRLYNILPERLRNLNDKYKTAINALYFILEDPEKIPMLDTEQMVITPKAGFFPKLTLDEVKTVFRKQMRFDVDQIIFAEGEKADGAYFIMKGKVKAVTFSKNYDEIILGQLGKDEIFGEMALIDDKPRSASIVTMSPCKVAFVEKKSFNEFLQTRSTLAFRLMAFVCLSLFKRILTLDKVYGEVKKAFG